MPGLGRQGATVAQGVGRQGGWARRGPTQYRIAAKTHSRAMDGQGISIARLRAALRRDIRLSGISDRLPIRRAAWRLWRALRGRLTG